MTPMKRYEYFRIKIDLFPQEIINKHNLCDKVDANGNVFSVRYAAECMDSPKQE